MDKRKTLGNWGETLVAEALERKGCTIVARQYRSRWGEIDVIARTRKGVLCFVEVKTRHSDRFAPARAAVTPAKQERLRCTAELYLAETGLDCPCRFDVAEVYPGPVGGWSRPRIHYIANAF